jgi:hypothetical protein
VESIANEILNLKFKCSALRSLSLKYVCDLQECSLTACDAGKKMSGMPESLSSKLAGITLPDADGNVTRLGSLWETGPAVVVFLRHYG